MATNANTSPRVNVEGKVKHSKKGEAVPFSLTLDFSKCSEAEIRQLAVDGIIVKLQSRTRSTFHAASNMGKDKKTPIKGFNKIVAENMSGVIDVKASIVSKARTPGKSLVEKTADMLKKMNPETRKAMLAQLSNIK